MMTENEELEALRELLKVADDVILPALDILPDTYDQDVRDYLRLREKLKRGK